MESGNKILEFSVRRRSSVDFDYDDDMEVESEIGGSEGTPSSYRKKRKRAVEESSDDDMKEPLKEDLAVIQKMEALKEELKKEKTIVKGTTGSCEGTNGC